MFWLITAALKFFNFSTLGTVDFFHFSRIDHRRRDRLFKALKEKFYWKGMLVDINRVVSNLDSGIQNCC